MARRERVTGGMAHLGCLDVANQRIWAPWRLPYVKDASKDSEAECIFCAKPAEDDDEANLIVHRGERCFVILNLFPYTNGHLMVAPYEHLATLPELDAETVGRDDGPCPAGDGRARREVRPPRLQRRASTRDAWPAPATRATSTFTSCPAGPATRTTCRCSPTRGSCHSRWRRATRR